MGAWGAGLYQDDVTQDIRNEYVNRLKVGYTNEEATEELIEYYDYLINDDDDGPLFWFALADTQWKYGRLMPKVKKEALKHIKNGMNLERWKEENIKLYPKRESVLKELEARLNSEQPPEKKVSKLTVRKSPWEVGDILLYKIKSDNRSSSNLSKIKNEELRASILERDKKSVEYLESSKYCNKYILLRVIGKSRSSQGSLPSEYDNEHAIVSVYNWVGDDKPNIDIIDHLSFLEDPHPLLKHMIIWKELISFNRRELKKLDFTVIKSDDKYKKEEDHIMSDVGIPWSNINNIDFGFIQLLEYAKEKGTLIDDTMK